MSDFTKTLIVDSSGGADYTTVKGAVDALITGGSGGVVIVEEDEYGISSTIEVPSNVTVIGRGNVILKVLADIPAIKNHDQTNGNERIVISGFKIVADRSNNSDYSNWLIDFRRTNNCVIENCTIIVKRPTSGSTGIHLQGNNSSALAEDNIVTGCSISGYDGAEGPYRGIDLYQYCERNMITANTVFDCRENLRILESSHFNIVSSNVIRDSDENGYYGGIYVYKSDHNIINGNECNCNKYGIYLRSSNQCSVQNNVCEGNNPDGIRIAGDSNFSAEYNSVVGNVSRNNTTSGIILAQYTEYNSVDGNTVSGNANGIDEGTTQVDYNAIIGNVCKDNSTENLDVNGQHSIGSTSNNVA